MDTVKCDEAGLAAAAAVLNRGGVAVIPTDTVYGLAARPDFPEAVERLYSIKSRPERKPSALLVADAAAAARFVSGDAVSVGERYWPGALTVVSRGEAVRIPDCEWTRRLSAACGGALRVTSANMSGARPVTDAGRSLCEAGLSADIAVDGGVSPGGVASTVLAVKEDGSLEILRQGPVGFLVLASGSPRRAKILKEHSVHFIVAKSDAVEVSYPGDPVRTVRENALAKGAAFPAPVLSADTIVWFNGKIYGKPADMEEAKRFLRELSGQTHSVFTAVAYNGDVRVVESSVIFRELSGETIERYVKSVNPLDRAGAYDIDESGSLIVESYRGSYENIMGLPVEPLRDWGIVQ